MFEPDKSKISINIDSTSRPFWTTGDVISGSVRLVVPQKISLLSVSIALVCNEIGLVARNDHDREVENEKKPKRGKLMKSKTIKHYEHVQSVLDASTAEPTENSKGGKSAYLLEPGEFVFPFAIDLLEEINSMPPSAVVKTRGGLELGVRWSLKVTARRYKKLQKNIKAKQLVAVFPKTLGIMGVPQSIIRGSEMSEMSGEMVVQARSGLAGFFQNKQKENMLFRALLKYPSPGLPQRPKPLPMQLMIQMKSGRARLHTVSIFLERRCQCSLRDTSDTYTTQHPISSFSVAREIGEQPLNLSNLLTKVEIPETMAPSFNSKVVSISYNLLLHVEFSIETDKKLRVFELRTPVDVVAPYLCWVGSSLPQLDGPQVSFNEPNQLRSRSVQTGTTRTGTGTGTLSSMGTLNSYEILSPTQVVTNWFSKWS